MVAGLILSITNISMNYFFFNRHTVYSLTIFVKVQFELIRKEGRRTGIEPGFIWHEHFKLWTLAELGTRHFFSRHQERVVGWNIYKPFRSPPHPDTSKLLNLLRARGPKYQNCPKLMPEIGLYKWQKRPKLITKKCTKILYSITMSAQHSVINYGKSPTF